MTTIDCGVPTAGQVMTCQVSGSSLSSTNISLSTSACALTTVQGVGTPTLQTFSCTTFPSAGASTAIRSVTVTRSDTSAGLRSIAIRLLPSPQPEFLTVSAVACSNAIANQLMVCAISGTGLSDTNYVVDIVDTLNPVPICTTINRVPGTGTRQRVFGCIPARAGLHDFRFSGSPGGGFLTAFFVTIHPTELPLRFREDFSNASLDSSTWTTYGSPVIGSGGIASFGAASTATTRGAVTVAGAASLVVEARFAGVRPSTASTGRDSYVSLVDAYTGDTITFGDASYVGTNGVVGMYATGAGAFAMRQAGNGISTSSAKEYRLTISGSAVLLERGDTLATITERSIHRLAMPATGRPFYLRIGSGSADYSPSSFDWITVRTDSAALPGPIATFFATAEGIWSGATGDGRNMLAFVLDSGNYWAIYNTTNNLSIGGLLQGTDVGIGGPFVAFDSKDVSLEGSGITERWVTGTYVPRQALNVQILNPATNTAISLNGAYQFDYEVLPGLGALSGTYVGTTSVVSGPTEPVTLTVSSTGRLVGVGSAGCSFDGYAAPHPKGNLYDIHLTFQGGTCSSGSGSMTGIGYYDSATRVLRLMAASSTRSNVVLVGGTKQ